MKTHLNLLPWRCRQRQMARLRLRQWLLPWGAALGAVAVLFLIQGSRHQAARARAEQLEEQCIPVDKLQEEIRGLRERAGALTRRESMLKPLEEPRPALTLLAMVSRSAEKCEGQLRVEKLVLRPAGEAGKAAAAPASVPALPGPAGGDTKAAATAPLPARPASTSLVTITGIALDNLAVARFVVSLRQTGAFDRVDLKSSEEKAPTGQHVCSYTIECAY